MANTYTYSQSPAHSGPLCATGKVEFTDASEAAQVEIGFLPSFVIVVELPLTDPDPVTSVTIWASGWDTAWGIISAAAVASPSSSPIALFVGDADDVKGFTIGTSLLSADGGTIWWIAFP